VRAPRPSRARRWLRRLWGLPEQGQQRGWCSPKLTPRAERQLLPVPQQWLGLLQGRGSHCPLALAPALAGDQQGGSSSLKVLRRESEAPRACSHLGLKGRRWGPAEALSPLQEPPGRWAVGCAWGEWGFGPKKGKCGTLRAFFRYLGVCQPAGESLWFGGLQVVF